MIATDTVPSGAPGQLIDTLPAALSAADQARIDQALRDSRAPNTRAQYLSAWKGWAEWSALRGHQAIPADPARWGDRRAAALPVVLTVPPSRLAAELQRCAEAGTYLAVVDTAPRAGSDNGAQVAAKLADLVLLPCRPSVLDVEAAADTAERVRAVTAAPVLALLTACAPRGQDADQVSAALAGVGLQVAPVRIGHRVALARSLLGGQVAQETEPGGRAAREVAAVHSFIVCTLERREHSTRGAA